MATPEQQKQVNEALQLLQMAQQNMNMGNFQAAAEIFTTVLTKYPMIQPVLPVLSRAICFVEMQEKDAAYRDIEILVRNPDVVLQEELIEGCPTTRLSGIHLGEKLAESLGDTEKQEEFQKLKVQALKDMEAHKDAALKLKEQGNQLFKQGQIDAAMTKYKESVAKDPFQATTWGNLCQCFMKKQMWEPAMEAANRCIRIQPDWPKGWYRKGMVLLSLNHPNEAFQVFSEGVRHCPDDKDLKSQFLELGKKLQGQEEAQVEKLTDKSLTGLLANLNKNSWNVREWYQERLSHGPGGIQFWKPLIQWKDLQANLKNPIYEERLTKVMQTRYPEFEIGSTPAEAEGTTADKDSIDAYFILNRPLLTPAHLLQLVKVAYPGGDWNIVFTFDYFPPLGLKPKLGGKVGPVYSAIVDRQRGFVLDWEWIAAHQDSDLDLESDWNPDHAGELFQGLMSVTGVPKGQWADEDPESEQAQIYTTSNGALFHKFLEQYYKAKGSDDVPPSPVSPTTTPTTPITPLNGEPKKTKMEKSASVESVYNESEAMEAKKSRMERREQAKAMLAQTTQDVKIPVTFTERLFAGDRDAMITFGLAVLILGLFAALWMGPNVVSEVATETPVTAETPVA